MTPFAFENRVFHAATGALLAEPIDPVHAAGFLRDFFARTPAHVAWGLRVVLFLTLISPFLFFGTLRSFLAVSEERRAEIWNGALDSRFYAVRQLATVLKAVACMVRFDDDVMPMPRLKVMS